MATIALIGPDGAGKTTVGCRLEKEKDLRIKYLYMGLNPEASTHALPTTRLLLALKRAGGKKSFGTGPPDPAKKKPRSRNPLRRLLGAVKSFLWMANQMGEEWYRQFLTWYWERRGFTVLFDRHFFSDYYAHDIAGDGGDRSLLRRIHGTILKRLYPKPDLFILLDAPAEVLYRRKGEGSPELLERRRQEYLRMRDQVPHFAVVNVDQAIEAVVQDAAQVIRAFLENRKTPRKEPVS